MILSDRAQFELAQKLRSKRGAPIAEVFTFLSGLYFRGKIAYATAFARPAPGMSGVLVITPTRGRPMGYSTERKVSSVIAVSTTGRKKVTRSWSWRASRKATPAKSIWSRLSTLTPSKADQRDRSPSSFALNGSPAKSCKAVTTWRTTPSDESTGRQTSLTRLPARSFPSNLSVHHDSDGSPPRR